MRGATRRRSVASVRCAAALDGLAVDLGEALGVGVQAGSDDRQHRPQVHQAVLDGGAGDGQLDRGVQAPNALVGLGAVVLDELRFVEHQHLPVEVLVLVVLQPEERV
jgi:hypothetical protein